jgi:hypothetical protein
MVAFDPAEDVAIAALVVDGGDGAQVVGPEVKTFFDDYRAEPPVLSPCRRRPRRVIRPRWRPGAGLAGSTPAS